MGARKYNKIVLNPEKKKIPWDIQVTISQINAAYIRLNRFKDNSGGTLDEVIEHGCRDYFPILKASKIDMGVQFEIARKEGFLNYDEKTEKYSFAEPALASLPNVSAPSFKNNSYTKS